MEKLVYIESNRTLRHDILAIGKMTMQLARVERVPRYHDGRRESDAEHSLMLIAVAQELAERFYPGLDRGLIAQFGGIHDITEIITDDVLTFGITHEGLLQKKMLEAEVSKRMQQSLPPRQANLLARYELQQEPEAREVRLTDKVMPLIVDILGQGERIMVEDCNTHDYLSLSRQHDINMDRLSTEYPDFPEILNIYAELAREFEDKFRQSPYCKSVGQAVFQAAGVMF